jgi:aminopeptidase YwaD
MFARTALLFLCLWCITPAHSGAQVTETARGYIEDLCSQRMHGRGYAFRGDRKASRYIARVYRKTGLKKVSASWYQPFPVSINTQPSGLTLSIDDRELTPGVEYIIAQGSPSFRGQCSLYHIDRTALLDSECMEQIPPGTFLLLDNNIGPGETDEQTRLLNELVAGLEQSPPASCAGIIICSGNKLTLKGFRERLPVPVIYLHSQEDLSDAVYLYLEVDSKYDPGYTTRNVMAFIRGKEYPDSLIIFTAHYDHLGTMGSGIYFPGANDNASGVAMILSLAGHYAKEEYRPGCSMLFIAFSAEEIGLLGSRYYVEHPA